MTAATNQTNPIFYLKTLSAEDKLDGTRVETSVYNNRSDWNSLELPEHVIPAQCTFVHPYFGPEELLRIQQPASEGGSVPLPCRLLARRELCLDDAFVEHKDILNSIYPAHCDIRVEQIVLECGGWYFLANRLKFYGLRHRPDPDADWTPIPPEVWANRNVRITEDGAIEADFYIVQSFHTHVLDVFCTMPQWPSLNLGRLCHIFFRGE